MKRIHPGRVHLPHRVTTVIAAAGAVAMTACGLPAVYTGAVLGGAAGAGLAVASLGGSSASTARATLEDAAIGGSHGRVLGLQMDRLADALTGEIRDADIERVGEGVLLTFDSSLFFEFDSDALLDAALPSLDVLANRLRAQPTADLMIFVHTDSTGSDRFNLGLSELRARALLLHLSQQGVSATRIGMVGMGETEPVADNGTEYGRALNRRIEMAIVASEAYREGVVAGPDGGSGGIRGRTPRN